MWIYQGKDFYGLGVGGSRKLGRAMGQEDKVI
jgi:hypothetical protein